MRKFGDCNPIVIFIFYIEVASISMLSMHPAILTISLFGAVLRCGREKSRTHLTFLAVFLVTALINPIVSHGGTTVLFVMNNSPVTLEATVYGVSAAAMIAAVLYWFRSFSRVMTGDRLLYVFGVLSPKFALVLSMSMRYIPLFGAQSRRVSNTQRALGRYRVDSIPDRILSASRVFSVMTSWTLENGIITADSMAARGYGTGKRTHFTLFRFRKADIVLLFISMGLCAVTCVGIALDALRIEFYPRFVCGGASTMGCISIIAYCALALMPSIIDAEERIRWNCLQSKI